MSKNRKYVIHKTIITDIKPKKYWEKRGKIKQVYNFQTFCKSKSITASGNIKIELENLPFYVLKHNKNLYAIAETVTIGDIISVALRQQLGKMYCVKLVKKGQELKERMHQPGLS